MTPTSLCASPEKRAKVFPECVAHIWETKNIVNLIPILLFDSYLIYGAQNEVD